MHSVLPHFHPIFIFRFFLRTGPRKIKIEAEIFGTLGGRTMALMGIDVGGTGVKAVVFGKGGVILSSSYQEYDKIQDHPGW